MHTGIECATEVNNQQMTVLRILCVNPRVTGDCIRTYLQLAPEAADQQDSEGMTPFQRPCRNDITFFGERNFSSLMACVCIITRCSVVDRPADLLFLTSIF